MLYINEFSFHCVTSRLEAKVGWLGVWVARFTFSLWLLAKIEHWAVTWQLNNVNK